MVNFKEKVKKFFLPSLSKKIFLVCLALISASFLFFPNLTFAAWWDWIVGAVTFIPYALINVFAQVILLATGALAAIAGGLLQWVTGDAFVSLSYTNPAKNEIIKLGLDVTRSFVNIGLVLALIVIAFTTILRTKNYETQKLLFKLIAVALLVNFSHVICGVIVDAANIMMNYFLENTSGLRQLTNQILSMADRVIPGWQILKTTEQISKLTESLALITFNLISFFVLLMFAFIFLLRYIAIWMLVILSPLAFVCYILPATKKIWEQWWGHLIQWSFVGVIAAFFLYLGEHVLTGIVNPNEPGQALGDVLGWNTSEVGVLNEIIVYSVPLGFLIFGLVMSLKLSAMGSEVIVSGFKGAGKAAVQKPWDAAKKRAGERAKSAALNVMPKKAKERLERESSLVSPFSKWGKEQEGFGGKAKRFAGGFANVLTSPYWAVRRGIGKTGLAIEESLKADVERVAKKAEGSSPDRNISTIVTGTKEDKIGALKGAIEKGQIGDLKKRGLGKKEILSINKEASDLDPDLSKKMIIATPKLADELREKVSPETAKQIGIDITKEDIAKGITSSAEKIISKVKASEVHKIEEESFEDPNVRRAIVRFWEGAQISKAADAFGRSFLDRFQKDIDAIEFKEPGWLEKNNSRLNKYLKGSAAGNLGVGLPDPKKPNEQAYEENKKIVDYIISKREPSGSVAEFLKKVKEKEKKDTFIEGEEKKKKKRKIPDTGEGGAVERKEGDVGQK